MVLFQFTLANATIVLHIENWKIHVYGVFVICYSFLFIQARQIYFRSEYIKKKKLTHRLLQVYTIRTN